MMRKTLAASLVLSVVALLTVSATAQKAGPLPEFDPEIVEGDIRVVLLSVDRCTRFSSQYVGQPDNEQVHAVPGVRVRILVEGVGKGMDTDRRIARGLKFFRDDERIRTAPTSPGVVSGGVTAVRSYREVDRLGFDLPPVSDPDRAFIRDDYLRGIELDGGSVDIEAPTGFGDDVRTFTFRNVPLN